MAKRSAEIIGDLAETTLELWAKAKGIAINKAYKDKTGWDYILEFPNTPEFSPSMTNVLDKNPPPLKCFLQVKGSDNRPGQCYVSLNNWVRMVDSPLPTFFLFMELNGQDSPERAYLVHVDRSYTYLVKKRLRELSAKAAKKRSSRKIKFSYRKNHRLSALDAHGLYAAIRDYVGDDLHTYSRAKMQDVATVGYENDGYVGKFSIVLPDKYKDSPMGYLVDHQLNLLPNKPVGRAEVSDSRFGIVVPGESRVFTDSVIEMPNDPIGKGTISFSVGDDPRTVDLEADILVPQGLPISVRDAVWKARFYSEFLEVILSPSKEESTFKWNLPYSSDRYKVRSLHKLAEILWMFHQAKERHVNFTIELSISGVFLGRAYFVPSNDIEEPSKGTLLLIEAIRNAWIVAKHFEIEDQAEVSTMELELQHGLIAFVAGTLQYQRGLIKFSFYPNEEFATSPRPLCIPFIPLVFLGNYVAVVGYAVTGNSQISRIEENGQIHWLATIEAYDTPVIRAQALNSSKEPNEARKRIHDYIEASYESTYQIIRLAEIHEYLS